MVHVAVATSRSVGTTTFVPKNVVETPQTSQASSDFKSISQKSAFAQQSNKTFNSLPIHSARGGALTINGNEVKGAIVFIALDYLFRKAFVTYGINFPSQLGGCCILLVAMLLAEAIKPGLGDSIFTTLTPGAGMLAKWLPVFFVPGLAMLPLAPSMGAPLEVSKHLTVDLSMATVFRCI